MRRFLLIALLLALLSGCVVPTPLPAPAAIVVPSDTPVPTAAAATPTPLPSATPTATPAQTDDAALDGEYRHRVSGLIWERPGENWQFQEPAAQAAESGALAALVSVDAPGQPSVTLHALAMSAFMKRAFREVLQTDPATAIRFVLIDLDLGRLSEVETAEVAGQPAVVAAITTDDGDAAFLWIVTGGADIFYLVARGFADQAEAALALQGLRFDGDTAVAGAPLSPEALTDRLIAQVEELRGLSLREEVPFEFLDRTDLGARLEEMADEESDPQETQQYEQMLKLLNLIPDDSTLLTMMQDLQESQVSGFYDDDTGAFYLVQEEEEESFSIEDQVTFVHEFAHALQDQYFDLSTFSNAEEMGYSEDERGAIQALVEGEATLVMLLWMLENLDFADVAELASGAGELDTEVMDQMPPYLVQGMLFPYEAGYVFAQSIFLEDDWEGIDALWQDLPASTEQILHPERYPGDVPTEVSLPADLAAAMGAGWTEQLRDVWGEIDLLLWLDEAGQRVARQGADGWDGSQYAFLTDDEGQRLFVIEIAWDSAAEATQGQESIAAVLAVRGYQPVEAGRLAGDGRSAYVMSEDDRVRVAIADDGEALEAALAALGWE